MRRRSLLALAALPVVACAAVDSLPVSPETGAAVHAVPAPVPVQDSVRPPLLKDSTGTRAAVRQQAASRKLPPRLLTFKEQLFYALVFMCYVAGVLFLNNTINP